MDIKISKSDIIWSYIAQIFNLSIGLITLPMILKMLNPDEIGLNYILISISSIISLFDLGFSSQFSRYLTYIFSGAQTIEKEGMSKYCKEEINEHLLACTLVASKRIYFSISVIALMSLLIGGTLYVWNITEGVIINNLPIIWALFCISSFFNIYYLYYGIFLESKGLVEESKKASLLSRGANVIIVFVLLFLNFGLLAVVIANFVSPFIFRIYAHKKFFTKDICRILAENSVSFQEIRDIFKVLFYNAKKLGVISILGAIIGYASPLVIGAYLPLSDVGSYGIMVQMVGIITLGATLYFRTYFPRLSSLLAVNDMVNLRLTFGISIFVFYLICLIGGGVVLLAPYLFDFFSFKVKLPVFSVLISYYIYRVLEQNQSLYSHLFLLSNDMRFYPSAVITGISTFICIVIMLKMGYGIMGVVIGQCVPLYLYAAWYWPLCAIKTYGLSINDIYHNPIKVINKYVRNSLS